jgi:hypothetical protein
MTKSFAEKCLVCEKSHINEKEFIQCIETNIDKFGEWRNIQC